MVRKVFSILMTSWIASALAVNVQVFAELQEFGTEFHLVAYSQLQSDHHHDGDDHAAGESGSRTHRHRHAADQPEHEHTQFDLGLVVSASPGPVSSGSELTDLKPVVVLDDRPLTDESLASSGFISSLLRPPIA